MSLSSRKRNMIVDAINVAFAAIGNTNGQRMPKTDNNRDPIAWEYWLASHIVALASKRKDAAERAAIAAEVLIDKAKNPQPPGNYVCYNGDFVSVNLQVRSAPTRVNIDELVAYLAANKVKQSLLDAAVKHATHEGRGAHVFMPVLRTDEAD